jgi:hypothetical protein
MLGRVCSAASGALAELRRGRVIPVKAADAAVRTSKRTLERGRLRQRVSLASIFKLQGYKLQGVCTNDFLFTQHNNASCWFLLSLYA